MKSRRIDFNNSEHIYLFFLVGMFFTAQLLYYLANSGFHSSFFGVDLMMVDLDAITSAKGHFWESIFYYNLSPPLYVLYASIFNILFPPNGELGFYFLHSLLGVYAIYCLYKIQRKLDVNPILATFLTTVFVLSPSFNLAETMAFYDFPVACLLIISVWRLAKLLENPCFSSAFFFFTVIALICSIRSLYHVFLYMLPVIFVTLIVLKKQWKIILLSSLIPFLFVFSVYLKNYILFDVFTTSSYFGETLDSIVMQFNVTLQQREDGIKQGFFSDLALCPSVPDSIEEPTATSKFGGWYCYATFVNKYRQAYINQLGKDYHDIPLLSCTPSKTKKPGLFLPRRSCLGNIGMSKEYEKNAIQAILHYPDSYLSGIQTAWRQYFNTHVSYYYEIMGNSRQLPATLSMSWLRLPLMSIPDLTLSISIPFLIIFPLLVFFSICYIFYSKKAILFLLSIYALVFFVTEHNAEAVFAGSQFIPILHNWGLQASLITWLLFMFIMMSLSVFLISIGIFIIKKTNVKSSSFIDNLLASNETYNKRIIVSYITGAIIYTTLTITFLVGIAQQRYRFYIDGLYLLLFSLFLQSISISNKLTRLKTRLLGNFNWNKKN